METGTGIRAAKLQRNRWQPTGQWIRREMRFAIYLRDRFSCSYCGADLHAVEPREITLDHIRPRCKGGSNSPRNLVTACRRCNNARGPMPARDFASPESWDEIQRRRNRRLARYVKLARSIVQGRKKVPETS